MLRNNVVDEARMASRVQGHGSLWAREIDCIKKGNLSGYDDKIWPLCVKLL
jgi:hypothetical protein